MLSTNESISFSKYGKTFQEKLAFLILDDRVFSDRMMEVLNVEFLEFKFLQVYSVLIESTFWNSTDCVTQSVHSLTVYR